VGLLDHSEVGELKMAQLLEPPPAEALGSLRQENLVVRLPEVRIACEEGRRRVEHHFLDETSPLLHPVRQFLIETLYRYHK
jgi:hypothetical protein